MRNRLQSSSAVDFRGGPDNITVVLARMLESMVPLPYNELLGEIEKADSGAVTKV